MKLTVRRKIVLLLVMPMAALYLSVMVFNIIETRKWASTNVEQLMTDLADCYASRLDGYFREIAQIPRMTAAYVEHKPDLTSEEMYSLLTANLEKNPVVYGSAIAFERYRYDPTVELLVRYVHREGNLLQRLDPTASGYDYTEQKQEYWHVPRDTGEAVWTEPYFDEGGGNIDMCTYSVPIFRNTEFYGVATVDIPLKPLRDLIELDIFKGTEFSIITGNGMFVYSPNEQFINRSIFEIARAKDRDDMYELAKCISAGQKGSRKLSAWDTDDTEWIFFAPIQSADWGFAASIPEKKALEAVQQQFNRNLVFLALSLLLIVAALWFFTVQVYRPITKLDETVSEIAKGNLNVRAEISSDDEIGMLARTLNDMAEKLTARERALRESEQKYKTLIDTIPQKIFYKDVNSVYLGCNRNYARDLNIKPDAIVGKTDYDFHPKELADKYRADDKRIIESGKVETIEDKYVRHDGQKFIVETMKTPMWNKNGKVVGLLGIFTDISSRKRSEASVQEWQNRYAAAIEASRRVLYDWDAETSEVVYGGNLEEILGYSMDEMQGGLAHWESLIHPDDRAYFKKVIEHLVQTREPAYLEYRVRKNNGVYIPVEDTGNFFLNAEGRPVRMVGFVADISQRKLEENKRKALEQQVQQIQKLESLGLLAGGIAHDFNNLLTAILGNAELALENLSKVSPARPCVEEIEQASMKAADLCRQMLAYSGKGRFDIMAVDLSEVVQEMMHLLETSISKKVQLTADLAENLPAVEADVIQIQQIIMNLLINASEALGGETGDMALTTGVRECSSQFLRQSRLPEIPPEGRYVYIEVADTGCGMDREALEKLFDPFFSTKFTGRGLGLSAVLGIVRGHRGAILVDSEVNRGTTFIVLLPAVDKEAVTRKSLRIGKSQPEWKGSGTILLVDDEETVIRVASRMLERLGFDVMTASNGHEAVEVFREHADEIVFVVLDFTMPNMDGKETYDEISRIRQDVRVILSSGYSEQDLTERFEGKGIAGFINKPYRLANLREVIKKVLLA